MFQRSLIRAAFAIFVVLLLAGAASADPLASPSLHCGYGPEMTI